MTATFGDFKPEADDTYDRATMRTIIYGEQSASCIDDEYTDVYEFVAKVDK